MNNFDAEEKCFKLLVDLNKFLYNDLSKRSPPFDKGDVFIGRAISYHRKGGEMTNIEIAYMGDLYNYSTMNYPDLNNLLDILQPLEFSDIWEMKRNGTWKQPHV